MSGNSETYSTQRRVWKRAESSRYSGKGGIGPLEERGYQGSGSDTGCSTGTCTAQPTGHISIEASFLPRTDLGKSLWDSRTRIFNSFLPLLSQDEVDREVRERRG